MTDDVALREYIEAKIADYERHHDALHVELQRAVDKADAALAERTSVALAAIDRRLDGMNEFRKSLEDVTNRAVPRDLFDVVTNRVTIIENTYVQQGTYQKDAELARQRTAADLEARDMRIAALEKTSVRGDVVDQQRDELQRTRKALIYSIVGGGAVILINVIFNVLQTK